MWWHFIIYINHIIFHKLVILFYYKHLTFCFMKQNCNVFMKKFWYWFKHTHSQREVLRKRTKHTYFGGCISRKWSLNVVKITIYMFLHTLHFKDIQPGNKGYDPIFANSSLKERETGKQSFSGLYSHWVCSKPLCYCVTGRENSLCWAKNIFQHPDPENTYCSS